MFLSQIKVSDIFERGFVHEVVNNSIKRGCLSFFVTPVIFETCIKRLPAISRGLDEGSTVLRAPWLVKNL